ncbi:MAG: DUF1553 domain-containing protein [Zavarzinella sp.]
MKKYSLPIALFFTAVCQVSAQPLKELDYNRDVQPILSENCFHCHGPDAKQRKGNLRLDTFGGATGKDGGAVGIIPGKSNGSELVARIDSKDRFEMMPPPDSNRKMTPEQKAILKIWIDQGAKYAPHWAFVPPKRPLVPEVPPSSQINNPIDQFIVARLTKEKISQSPEADPAKLLRRLTLDLTGLPPTLEELDTYLAADPADRYEKAVDRLLGSPRFGERMMWDWLESARYADTNGYQGDPTRAMWYWRDWALNAFNANMPFDQFSIEQLAGDLMPQPTRDQLVATGFHRNHMINGEGGRIAEESRVEYVFDRVETTGTIWMGLTFNCCRCHDHKYDPLLQKEYYQLSAFFNSIAEEGGPRAGLMEPTLSLPTPEQETQQQLLQIKIKALKDAVAPMQAELLKHYSKWLSTIDSKQLPAPLAKLLEKSASTLTAAEQQQLQKHFLELDAEYKSLQQTITKLEQNLDQLNKSIPRTMIMRDRLTPRATHVLIKGAYNQYGEKVSHGVPNVLPPMPKDTGMNRYSLAKWIMADSHPLTARVLANRFWQQFFGIGLVKTPEDFGLQGERPSHPELLDWLAVEFRDNNWDLKKFLRLLVTSHTYRQSSNYTGDIAERDPENRLLSHSGRRRLPSWMLRDQALAMAGLLVEHVGGPPVRGYQPPGIWEDATFGQIKYTQQTGTALYRRSIYQFWRRIVGPTMFFDVANRQNCVVQVTQTNTPLHALTLMNDVTYVEAARVIAQNLISTNASTSDRIKQLFREATARPPSAEETVILLQRYEGYLKTFTSKQDEAKALLQVGESKPPASLNAVELAAWTSMAMLVLNLDEVLSQE